MFAPRGRDRTRSATRRGGCSHGATARGRSRHAGTVALQALPHQASGRGSTHRTGAAWVRRSVPDCGGLATPLGCHPEPSPHLSRARRREPCPLPPRDCRSSSRADLPSGSEEWTGKALLLATGDAPRDQALFSFVHGMVIFELDDRFPAGATSRKLGPREPLLLRARAGAATDPRRSQAGHGARSAAARHRVARWRIAGPRRLVGELPLRSLRKRRSRLHPYPMSLRVPITECTLGGGVSVPGDPLPGGEISLRRGAAPAPQPDSCVRLVGKRNKGPVARARAASPSDSLTSAPQGRVPTPGAVGRPRDSASATCRRRHGSAAPCNCCLTSRTAR